MNYFIYHLREDLDRSTNKTADADAVWVPREDFEKRCNTYDDRVYKNCPIQFVNRETVLQGPDRCYEEIDESHFDTWDIEQNQLETNELHKLNGSQTKDTYREKYGFCDEGIRRRVSNEESELPIHEEVAPEAHAMPKQKDAEDEKQLHCAKVNPSILKQKNEWLRFQRSQIKNKRNYMNALSRQSQDAKCLKLERDKQLLRCAKVNVSLLKRKNEWIRFQRSKIKNRRNALSRRSQDAKCLKLERGGESIDTSVAIIPDNYKYLDKEGISDKDTDEIDDSCYSMRTSDKVQTTMLRYDLEEFSRGSINDGVDDMHFTESITDQKEDIAGVMRKPQEPSPQIGTLHNEMANSYKGDVEYQFARGIGPIDDEGKEEEEYDDVIYVNEDKDSSLKNPESELVVPICTNNTESRQQSSHTDRLKRRKEYELMVKVFQPLLEENVIVRRVLPHMQFLTDPGKIRAIEERDPRAAVVCLINDIYASSSTEPGRWRQFVQALETCGYKYIVDNLRGQDPVEHTHQKQHLKNITPVLRELIYPAELLPVLWVDDVISNEDKEEIGQIEKNLGSLAAVDKLLDLVPRRNKQWYSNLVDALRTVGRTEAADMLAIPEMESFDGKEDVGYKKQTSKDAEKEPIAEHTGMNDRGSACCVPVNLREPQFRVAVTSETPEQKIFKGINKPPKATPRKRKAQNASALIPTYINDLDMSNGRTVGPIEVEEEEKTDKSEDNTGITHLKTTIDELTEMFQTF